MNNNQTLNPVITSSEFVDSAKPTVLQSTLTFFASSLQWKETFEVLYNSLLGFVKESSYLWSDMPLTDRAKNAVIDALGDTDALRTYLLYLATKPSPLLHEAVNGFVINKIDITKKEVVVLLNALYARVSELGDDYFTLNNKALQLLNPFDLSWFFSIQDRLDSNPDKYRLFTMSTIKGDVSGELLYKASEFLSLIKVSNTTWEVWVFREDSFGRCFWTAERINAVVDYIKEKWLPGDYIVKLAKSIYNGSEKDHKEKKEKFAWSVKECGDTDGVFPFIELIETEEERMEYLFQKTPTNNHLSTGLFDTAFGVVAKKYLSYQNAEKLLQRFENERMNDDYASMNIPAARRLLESQKPNL